MLVGSSQSEWEMNSWRWCNPRKNTFYDKSVWFWPIRMDTRWHSYTQNCLVSTMNNWCKVLFSFWKFTPYLLPEMSHLGFSNVPQFRNHISGRPYLQDKIKALPLSLISKIFLTYRIRLKEGPVLKDRPLSKERPPRRSERKSAHILTLFCTFERAPTLERPPTLAIR